MKILFDDFLIFRFYTCTIAQILNFDTTIVYFGTGKNFLCHDIHSQ